MIDLNRVLLEKRPDYRRRQHKVIFLHDNAQSHTAKWVKEMIKTFKLKKKKLHVLSYKCNIYLFIIQCTGLCPLII